MLKVNEKQLESVFSLTSKKRYLHFIKQVADWEVVWGLFDEGWALSETSEGFRVFPCWPAKEYARKCASEGWDKYEPKSISLDEFMRDFLPDFQRKSILIGVFPDMSGHSIVQEADKLSADINEEFERYC